MLLTVGAWLGMGTLVTELTNEAVVLDDCRFPRISTSAQQTLANVKMTETKNIVPGVHEKERYI